MTETKIYIALSELSVYELNSFKKYLHSPYFNSNSNLIELYEIYYTDLKRENDQSIEKEVIWSTIFPEKTYNDGKLRKLNSELLKVFEEFLGQRSYDNNKMLKSNMKLKAIREKKLIKLYKSVVSSSERNIENQFNRSSDYLYSKFYHVKEKFELYSENELLRKRSKNIAKDVNISEITDFLDRFYISEKLKYLVSLQSWKKNFKIEQEIEQKEALTLMIDSGAFDDVPSILIYNTIYKTQLEPDKVENYFTLKELVREYIDIFPDHEIRNIYDALLSFTVRRVNKGDLSFQEETLNVYKDALAKEVLFQDGYMTAITFNNIVFFALRTSEYDWAESFVDEYGHLLKEGDRNNSVSLSKSRIAFYRKDFGKVIELLQQVDMESNSYVYNLSAKTLLLSSYYELDEFDALDSLLNSFRVFLNREKAISARIKSLYKNLIRIVKKMVNISPSDKQSMTKLIEEIESSDGVVIKPWLLEKMREKRGF